MSQGAGHLLRPHSGLGVGGDDLHRVVEHQEVGEALNDT